MAPGVPSLVIARTSATVVTLASLGFTPFETWTRPSAGTSLMLVVAAVALLAGQYWLIAAMRTGEIAVVAPFRYSIIVWAILPAISSGTSVPDLLSWIGIAIVSVAGLYTFLREQQLARMAKP